MKHYKSWKNMLLAGGMFIGAYAMADLTDAEWKAMKEAALAKPRPVIANNDGCDATAFPKSDKHQKISLEQFHAYDCLQSLL